MATLQDNYVRPDESNATQSRVATKGKHKFIDKIHVRYVEELRPIQLSRFDFEGYQAGRREFTRDEWLDSVMRSVELEPSKLSKRLKFHFVARLAPLVEPNFNFVELGPRGTGKSYFYSEFSPYSTLISGVKGNLDETFVVVYYILQ